MRFGLHRCGVWAVVVYLQGQTRDTTVCCGPEVVGTIRGKLIGPPGRLHNGVLALMGRDQCLIIDQFY